MSLLARLHEKHVAGRRIQVLCDTIAPLLRPHGTVLDVGCGDGELAARLLAARPDLSLSGLDVLVRPSTHIPVRFFDGTHLPAEDASVDAVLLVDVLHHTDDPLVLLREARRVTRGVVILKDHLLEGVVTRLTLRFMDWVGNARHGVRLPYNYWRRPRWDESFAEAGLVVEQWVPRLPLYPAPASFVFGGSLHFVAQLKPHPSLPSLAP